MRKSCVQVVGSLRATVEQMGEFMHQVVFATCSMGISQVVMHVFPGATTQLFAQLFSRFNSGGLVVVPVMHRTNDKGN